VANGPVFTVLWSLVTLVLGGFVVPQLLEALQRRRAAILWSLNPFIYAFWGQSEEGTSARRKARIVLWNNSRGPIKSTDVAETDPLRIVGTSGERLLHVEVIARSPGALTAAAKLEPTRVLISFEFLNARSGLVVDVEYDGGRLSDLVVRGSVLGLHLRARFVTFSQIVLIRPGEDPRRRVLRQHRNELILTAITFAQAVCFVPLSIAAGFVSGWTIILAASQAVLLALYSVSQLRGYLWLPSGLESFFAVPIKPRVVG
jgi:hypothetical protein